MPCIFLCALYERISVKLNIWSCGLGFIESFQDGWEFLRQNSLCKLSKFFVVPYNFFCFFSHWFPAQLTICYFLEPSHSLLPGSSLPGHVSFSWLLFFGLLCGYCSFFCPSMMDSSEFYPPHSCCTLPPQGSLSKPTASVITSVSAQASWALSQVLDPHLRGLSPWPSLWWCLTST